MDAPLGFHFYESFSTLTLRPQDISRVSGNLLGIGDGFPNTLSVLMEHRYNTDCCMIMPVTVLFNTSCSVVCDNSGLSRGKVSPRRTHAAEMLKETKRLLSIMMAAHKKSHLVYAGFFSKSFRRIHKRPGQISIIPSL